MLVGEIVKFRFHSGLRNSANSSKKLQDTRRLNLKETNSPLREWASLTNQLTTEGVGLSKWHGLPDEVIREISGEHVSGQSTLAATSIHLQSGENSG